MIVMRENPVLHSQPLLMINQNDLVASGMKRLFSEILICLLCYIQAIDTIDTKCPATSSQSSHPASTLASSSHHLLHEAGQDPVPNTCS